MPYLNCLFFVFSHFFSLDVSSSLITVLLLGHPIQKLSKGVSRSSFLFREMGFISRKIFPACGRMCVCCPALRSRSRQPVKRYKKLVADIFPKSPDGEPNERKIVKLCEYAAKNPIRIPKITSYLEERFYKELRYGQLKVINVVTEAYNKLLCMCGKQMAYFAASVLNVVVELLDSSKQTAMQIAGCQVLARFVYSQTDGTYSRNIESLVHKVCILAHCAGEEHSKCLLRASSLQCVSAILWFMSQFSLIFDALDEIVQAALDNYESDGKIERADVGHQRVQWVDEVVRCEAQVGDASPRCISVRPPPVKKNISLLTRVETEMPKVWAQICIQGMAELANESTSLRQILEPMFVYFDNGRHWDSQHGLAVMVLSDMCYFMENSASENRQLLLAAVIRHLDHKSIAHDPSIKSYIIQVATCLARQIRAGAITVDVGYVGDLCRHLRKSLQATAGPLRQEEMSLNVQLQNSIEACLLEIAKGMNDARSFFDLMTITMEKLPPVGVVARAVIGSLIILAHVLSVASARSQSQQVFPEALLVQLLKAMLHPDTETRIGAHRIFSILLFPSAHHIRQETTFRKTGYCYDTRWHASTISKFASVNTLLEKLRKEKNDFKAEKRGDNMLDDCKGSEFTEEEKQNGALKNSSNFYCVTSLFDRNAALTDVTDIDLSLTKLSEDQILQLLSGFWIQANLPDNLPSNFEAISHSYSLTLILAHSKNSNHGLVVIFFQLALSLRNISLDPNYGMLPPSCRRMLLVTSTAMLMFAAKTYHINELIHLLKSLVPNDVDPYLGISEDLHAFVRPQADLLQCGMSLDNQMAASMLCELRDKNYESEKSVLDILARHLCCINKQSEDKILRQLLEVFSPDDALMFAPQSVRNLEHIQTAFHSRGLPSIDDLQDLSATSTADDEGMSVSSVANINCLPAKVSGSPSISQIISIGKLLESALEVAGQVAGTSVSTSPLPYSVMASQCESLGTGTRKRLSNWLAHENIQAKSDGKLVTTLLPNEEVVSNEVPSLAEPIQGSAPVKDPSWTLRLPPASPFDNFLKSVTVANLDVAQVAI